jgi:hypothetical protein
MIVKTDFISTTRTSSLNLAHGRTDTVRSISEYLRTEPGYCTPGQAIGLSG